VAEALIDTVDRLLEAARPGGLAHRRLLKYREQLERNVFLGPSILRYIRELVAKMEDDIECRFLSELGLCKKTKLTCKHVDDNRACKLYEAERPHRRRR